MSASTQALSAERPATRTVVALLAIGVSAATALITAWGILALLVATVFGALSLRKATRFKPLLVMALAVAGVVLVGVAFAGFAAASAMI
ncbi:MAG: hypothetical protein BGN97_01520 [Microbacterium sp. 69-10]|uniref:hypothetical protein n=1 Tax=Microbacterium sp. 69-10 TaxID=1895783 RepID=UPI0009663735|nr:hypothetical protein [Microbacterium sp. 69-10]OJU42229.1 MAG: hypothetical protein BGN97_01520 [Microbacterium sp. 69-10]